VVVLVVVAAAATTTMTTTLRMLRAQRRAPRQRGVGGRRVGATLCVTTDTPRIDECRGARTTRRGA